MQRLHLRDKRRRRVIAYTLSMAIGIAAATIGVTNTVRRADERDATTLREILRDGRPVACRISGGYEWSRYAKTNAVQAKSALGLVFAQPVHSAREEGVAFLIAGRPHPAVERLQAAARYSRDPFVWSDLAAARDAEALQSHRPDELRYALVAVLTAVRLGKVPEALFNRAMILEHLGVLPLAVEAWRDYLRVDPSSGWAREAIQHLRALQTQAPPDFRGEIHRAIEQLSHGNAAPLVTLSREHRQEARLWAEGPLLLEWAAAHASGSASESASLDGARIIGQTLAQDGDHLVLEAVDSIIAATPDARITLADAHTLYGEGRKQYSRARLVSSAPLLERAAGLFSRGGSPMTFTARYYAACAKFDQGHIDEAARILRRLRDTVDHERFPALAAQIQWQLGLCEFARNHLGAAAEHFRRSADIFAAIGERPNAAFTRELLAETLEYHGQTIAAWRERPAILRDLWANAGKLYSALANIAIVAVDQRQVDVAEAFLSLETDLARQVNDVQLGPHALTQRGIVHLRNHNPAATRADLDEARRQIEAIQDAAIRSRLNADLEYVEALLAASVGAKSTTISSLSKAIDFHGKAGRRMYVPMLLLERARCYRAEGKSAAAQRDLTEAIAIVEQHRDRVASTDLVDETTTELFTFALEDRLMSHDVAGAFRVAERERAISLAGAPAPALEKNLRRALGPDTVLLEYTLLPTRIVIFVVTHQGIQAISRDTNAPLLEGLIDDLQTAITAREGSGLLKPKFVALYEELITPVRTLITSHRHVIVVPGGLIARVPFAALYDRSTHQYLVETHTITFAPSAASYVRSRFAKSDAVPHPATVLVIANPWTATQHDLPAATAEGRSIAELYETPLLLSGKAATVKAFIENARGASVIHFAGHAFDGTMRENASCLVFTQDANGGVLDNGDIAALPLRSTRIAVLAACRSGVSGSTGRERFISVARAFLAAGVPSVIAASWDIPDEQSATLFINFHRLLARGISPAEALRHVQTDAIRSADPTFSNPATWAAIQDLGN